MTFNSFRLSLSVAATALLATTATLSAATVGNLVAPDGANAPGWYDGSSPNPNGDFTITNTNGIELGLRAKLRQDPNTITPVNGVYYVPTGTEVSNIYHGANANRAQWNFEFSVDLGPAGSGMSLSQITGNLVVTDLTGGGGFHTFDIFGFGDDAEFGTGGVVNQATNPNQANQWGAQNSENPLFFPTFAGLGDINTGHTYQFDLNIFNLAGQSLATDSILVTSQTPEPATFGLFGSAIAGIAIAVRRRVRK